MRKLAIILLVALVAFSFGPALHGYAQGKVVRVSLIDENGSGEDGSAQLTDMGDGTTKVELIMLNAPEGADQPAHIHKGTCANLDPTPAYPLNSVKESKSTTIVKVALADLTKEKYAINVHKSAAEAVVYVSCGNLPSGTSSSGPMTLDQVTAKLLDDANELLGTVKKKETDASQNAYNTYHATFAAHEDEIKAREADAQSELEEAMHGVSDALKAGDWSKSETAAQKLVDKVKEIQTDFAGTSGGQVGGGQASGSMADAIGKLQSAAADLQRETKNADADGSQNAYNDFHTLFAANEDAIKARNHDGQAHIEAAMHEVNDAIQAKDFKKAATAADELANEVSDAGREMGVAGTSNSDMPRGGSPISLLPLAALAAAAMGLMLVGGRLRRTSF
jgi:hypothetical protein